MRTRATFFYLLSSYANILYTIISGLLLVPFYLKDFGSEVYGVWLATGNLISWFGIMGGSLSVVLAQGLAVSHAKTERDEFRQLVGSGLILYVILAIVILAGVWITSDWFLTLFSFNRENLGIIKLAIFYATLATSISVFQSPIFHILGAWMENGPMLKSTLIGGGAGIVVNILLLINGYGLLSIPLAMLAKVVVVLAILMPAVIKSWRKRMMGGPMFDWKFTRKLASRSSPVLLSNIASIGLNHSQSTIIGLLFGPHAATIVSVTDKLFSLMKSFIYPFGNALLQPLSSLLHVPDHFEEISKKFIRHIDLLTLSAILVCLVMNELFISIWVGSEYYGGLLVSVSLALASYSIIRVNLMISVLNAKGMFRMTSGYGILDLVLRILILSGLYFIAGFHHMAVLPITECLGILIATRWVFYKYMYLLGLNRLALSGVFGILIGLGFLSLQWMDFQFYFQLISIALTLGFLAYALNRMIKERIIQQVRESMQSIRNSYAPD